MQIESGQVIKIFLLTFINYVSNILALKIDKTIKITKLMSPILSPFARNTNRREGNIRAEAEMTPSEFSVEFRKFP